jgi:[ribosomal protein S5]-alanine N-acetyltransferase
MKTCGHTCAIRSWSFNDIASLTKHANDYEVWKGMRDVFPHPYSEADAGNWISCSNKQEPERNFAIDIAGTAIGGIGFVFLDDVNRYCAEIGFWLGRGFWGQGIASEAVTLATDYALSNFDVVRIFGVVFTTNLASRRVLEKCHYTHEAILRSSAYKDGHFVDSDVFAMVSQEQLKKKTHKCAQLERRTE